jgi:hypothetical protein
MKEHLSYYVEQMGMAAILKALSEIAEDHAKQAQFKDVAGRWDKASIHLHQLSTKKFIQPL